MSKNVEERVQISMDAHKKGFNCAQSVIMAFDDIYPDDTITMMKMSEGMGMGVAGSMNMCGAITGMVMLEGLENSDGNLENPKSKPDTVKKSRALMDEFEEKVASTICKEIKGVDTGIVLKSCNACIEEAVRIYAKHLENK